MNTLRGRLVLSHTLPLLLIVPLIGAALAYLIETHVLLVEVSDDLTSQASLIAETLRDRPEIWRDPDQAAAFVARIRISADRRLFLLHAAGQLWVSSDRRDLDRPGWPLDVPGLATAAGSERRVLVSYDWFTPRAGVLLPIDDGRRVIGIVGLTRAFDDAASPFARLRQLVAGLLAIELLLGALIGFVLAEQIARPIRRAAAAVIAIADGAQIEPLPIAGAEELRRLSTAVKRLAERLRQLEELRRRAFANIVHELGRPLGAMRSAVHVLRQGAGDDPAIRQELLTGVEDEITRMQPLLDNLTQLHAQAFGTQQLARRPVALGEWLATLIAPWRAAALDKGLVWQATIPLELPTVDIDPDRLGQAIGNLLSNAIKYTPAGGDVRFSASANSDEVWIEIADAGPGIAEDERERLFEPFYRSSQHRRFPQGLGLGLTIARDLVVAHGGRIEVASVPEVGSRFTIHLPIVRGPLIHGS
jgi:two-component system, OmpR family, sensor histidine kinase BaeS